MKTDEKEVAARLEAQRKRHEEHMSGRPTDNDVENELTRRIASGDCGVFSGLGGEVFSRIGADGPFQVVRARVSNEGLMEILLLGISEDDLTTRTDLKTTEHKAELIQLYSFEEIEAVRDACDFAMKLLRRQEKGPK